MPYIVCTRCHMEFPVGSDSEIVVNFLKYGEVVAERLLWLKIASVETSRAEEFKAYVKYCDSMIEIKNRCECLLNYHRFVNRESAK